MSSLGSAVGQSINWITGDEGKTKTTVNVKNTALQKEIDAGLKDFASVRDSGQNALKDYITKYLAGEGDATTRTGTEIGNLDRYFNGGASNELAYLRAQRKSAIQDAADRASGYALGNINRSRALQDGGPSSYDRRLALRNTGDIMTQAAMDDASQARNDWNYLEQAKAGYTGQRQRLADALAGYRLVPEQTRRGLYGQDLGFLGQIGELDRGNKFYGLKYDPTIGEEIGTHVGDLANAAMQGFSMFSGGGMGGMGGGGGGSGSGGGASTSYADKLPTIPSYTAQPSFYSPQFGMGGYQPQSYMTQPGSVWGQSLSPSPMATYNPYAYSGWGN